MTGSTTALRAWINHNSGITGRGNPLPQGAYLRQQRSPAHGAYAVLIREMGTDQDLVAEPGGPHVARITAHIYAGTIEAAETACEALDAAWRKLTSPTPAGDTGITIVTAANFSAPGLVPPPGEGGEIYEYQCSCDIVLCGS